MLPYEWRSKSRKAIQETSRSAVEKELWEAQAVVDARKRELANQVGAEIEIERDDLEDAVYSLRARQHSLQHQTRAA